MFWIILFVVSSILTLSSMPYMVSTVTISAVVVVGQLVIGRHTYHQLIKRLLYIKKMDEPFHRKDPILSLNEHVKIDKRAEYNRALTNARQGRETFILYFFGHGWAISNKIYLCPYYFKYVL